MATLIRIPSRTVGRILPSRELSRKVEGKALITWAEVIVLRIEGNCGKGSPVLFAHSSLLPDLNVQRILSPMIFFEG